MKPVPIDHERLLQKDDFELGCSLEVFSRDEVRALRRYGHWLQALAEGTIAPTTAAQERFVRVARGEVEPTTLYERAWTRLMGRREYEREQKEAPPPPPPRDYGIVEFDADPCWW